MAELGDDERAARIMANWGISREQYDAYYAAKAARDKRTPAVGAAAPDFAVERLDAKGKRTGETFRLSSTRGRPVALVMGSYT